MYLNRLQGGDASLYTTVASLFLPPDKMFQVFSTSFLCQAPFPDAGWQLLSQTWPGLAAPNHI